MPVGQQPVDVRAVGVEPLALAVRRERPALVGALVPVEPEPAQGVVDLLLAVGSTLSVYPAANCVPRAKAKGARVVIVNGGPTDMDRLADAVLNGQIADLLPALIRPG